MIHSSVMQCTHMPQGDITLWGGGEIGFGISLTLINIPKNIGPKSPLIQPLLEKWYLHGTLEQWFSELENSLPGSCRNWHCSPFEHLPQAQNLHGLLLKCLGRGGGNGGGENGRSGGSGGVGIRSPGGAASFWLGIFFGPANGISVGDAL